jgi:hypothetical protein
MLFDQKKDPAYGAASRRVKAWAAGFAGMGEEDTVMVTELKCTESGCPPLETVIAVLRAGVKPFQAKVHKPVTHITEDDVRVAFGQGSPHEH